MRGKGHKSSIAQLAVPAIFPLTYLDIAAESGFSPEQVLAHQGFRRRKHGWRGATWPLRTMGAGFHAGLQVGLYRWHGCDALGLLGVTLDSSKGRHVGSTMIPSDSDNRAVDEWSRLGLTGKVKVSKSELRHGTLIPKLPILVANDGRLLPQTFEGGQITSSEFKDLTLTGGRIEHATGRGSTDRTGLAAMGGTRESNQFDFAGGDWKATKDLTAQYYYANLDNYYTQQFFGLIHMLALSDNQSLKTDLRYFKTDSSGENSSGTSGYRISGYTKNGDGEIDNRTWSAALVTPWEGTRLLQGINACQTVAVSPSSIRAAWQTKAPGAPAYTFIRIA